MGRMLNNYIDLFVTFTIAWQRKRHEENIFCIAERCEQVQLKEFLINLPLIQKYRIQYVFQFVVIWPADVTSGQTVLEFQQTTP
jgi:hypothetical protein